MKIYSCYQLGQNCLWLPIEKIRVTTWKSVPISTNRKNTSYNLILLIVGLYNESMQIPFNILRLVEIFIPLDSRSKTETQSLSPVLVPLISFSSLTGRVSCNNINSSLNYFQNKLYITNPFPPDLWHYIYGFDHHSEDMVAPLWH